MPGEFFAPSPEEHTDVTDFVSGLRAHIGKLRPVPAFWHAAPFTFIFKDLATDSHIFLRHGVLQALYVGPYGFSTGAIRPIQSTFRVPHDRLLTKIAATGVDWRVVMWIKEFLLGRSQRGKLTGNYQRKSE